VIQTVCVGNIVYLVLWKKTHNLQQISLKEEYFLLVTTRRLYASQDGPTGNSRYLLNYKVLLHGIFSGKADLGDN